MFNSTIIEVAIGLILVYLVLGLVCTSINEYIAQLLGLRAENLVETIYGLFDGDGEDRHLVAEDIYDHPQIRSLSRKQVGFDVVNGFSFKEIDKLPSSISPESFATVLADLLRKNDKAQPDDQYDPLTLAVLDPILRDAQKSLTAAKTAGTSQQPDDIFDHAKPGLESWYSEALQRSGGWYKRRLQVMSLMVAVGLVLVLNADTISMYQRLANTPVERAKLVALANSVQRKDPGTATTAGTGATQEPVTEIEISDELKGVTFDFLGWENANSSDPRRVPRGFDAWMFKILGLAMTAFAVSLGAPFWFDVLSKFMTVRSGGDPAPKKNEKAAKAMATAEVKS